MCNPGGWYGVERNGRGGGRCWWWGTARARWAAGRDHGCAGGGRAWARRGRAVGWPGGDRQDVASDGRQACRERGGLQQWLGRWKPYGGGSTVWARRPSDGRARGLGRRRRR